ncbi:hypothetical protein N8793_03265, partial [Pseudomonadales bacterium]|nr:hypothetical protein [Pseudomonadales bacterium]
MISWDEYNEEAANGASATATQAAPEVVSAAAAALQTPAPETQTAADIVQARANVKETVAPLAAAAPAVETEVEFGTSQEVPTAEPTIE